jgi:hypothetical protein
MADNEGKEDEKKNMPATRFERVVFALQVRRLNHLAKQA